MITYRKLLEKFRATKDNPIVISYKDSEGTKVFSSSDFNTLSQVHGFNAKDYIKNIETGKLVKIPGTKKNKFLYVKLAKK